MWPTIQMFRLHLADVTPSPDLPWARPTFSVFAFLVEHPDGPVLIDTGVGLGHDVIDELYSPVHHDLDEALAEHGVEVSDVTTVIRWHRGSRSSRLRVTRSGTSRCSVLFSHDSRAWSPGGSVSGTDESC